MNLCKNSIHAHIFSFTMVTYVAFSLPGLTSCKSGLHCTRQTIINFPCSLPGQIRIWTYCYMAFFSSHFRVFNINVSLVFMCTSKSSESTVFSLTVTAVPFSLPGLTYCEATKGFPATEIWFHYVQAARKNDISTFPFSCACLSLLYYFPSLIVNM